ncbi:MAG: aminotransferase class I/II-fold pyridoxal phosphate-dependent enzyme, partial [Hyphomicrobium sp.]
HLRNQTMENAIILREALARRGIEVYGTPSPMVITRTGDERKARLVYAECLRRGLILNCIEYPACRRGEARLRLQVSPRHTPQQLATAAEIIVTAIAKLNSEMRSSEVAAAGASPRL